MSETPFFSIVIPTRNRADTLKYTIKTILNQDFQDYEIIICNNNSVDDTEEIVKKFSDKRIKYLKSNIDLSMSDNWELAYSKVTGQYVTYLADNDGFINGSLSFMYKLLSLNNYPNIIRWEKNLYNWPCMDSVNKNTLYINLEKKFEIYDSNTIINEIIQGKRKFQDLPMIYNSFIKNNLINQFKLKTHRLFHSVSPDISTGFSFSMLEKNYLSLSYGITCGANSAKSNGYNCMRKKDNNISKDFKNLIATSKINFHSNIPFVKSLMAAITESYLKINELLTFNKMGLDIKQTYINIIKDVTIIDKNDLEDTKNKIINASKFDDELHNFINEFLKQNPLKINPHIDIKLENGFKKNGALVLDAQNFNISNIEEACKFMGSFYNYSLNTVSFPIISESNLNLIEKSSKIVIWGSGSSSRKLQELLLQNKRDIEIYCIIDSFKEEKSNKIPILLPKNVDFSNVNYLIIASSFLNEFKETLLLLDIKEVKILKYESK